MIFCGNRCNLCGTTLEEGEICIGCIKDPPPWSRFAFWGLYREGLRDIIGRFKYRGDFSYLTLLRELLYEAYISISFDMDIVVPIPMHPNRLKKRGFNHVLELSKVFIKTSGARVYHKVLTRVRDTGVQVGLNRKNRLENVKNAFKCEEDLEGMSVLLVDDVYTTGATASECAAALLRGGAREIALVVIARSVEM